MSSFISQLFEDHYSLCLEAKDKRKYKKNLQMIREMLLIASHYEDDKNEVIKFICYLLDTIEIKPRKHFSEDRILTQKKKGKNFKTACKILV
jgi:hypothetical protein